MQLENKVAVVTGAVSGIGKAIVLAFAREGAAVTVDYRSHPDGAKATVEQIKDTGGKALAVQADVTKPEDVKGLIQSTVEKFGRLDIMVNNAGMERKMPFLQTPLEVWNQAISVNLTGPWLGCQEAARQLVEQGGPRCIITSPAYTRIGPCPLTLRTAPRAAYAC